ncbi:armadillo-type protein [Epithele typhae]|uniref:armadillo-type protein n=1 Tax=Epithele typhae TaxID=378194 RepID=UPI00200730B8|nr:armadillo-type protein [Epithele typhae]KAH9944165.1 armadillo-type protein [Epithele typhae]
MENVEKTQSAFQRLKVTCVPLLANSLLSSASIPTTNQLLSNLRDTIVLLKQEGHVFAPATISYVFFPISSILRRNDPSSIPDRTMEILLSILADICDVWWLNMEMIVWEQLFMWCSAILGGIDRKGKGRDRDDETKTAAAACLWTLLRRRTIDANSLARGQPDGDLQKLEAIRSHVQSLKFLPVLGQSLNSLMVAAESAHPPLQRTSLKVLATVVEDYLPDGFVPSVLPGTISTLSKVALGSGSGKGWANGDVVAAALFVMQHAIIRAISDAACIREGAIRAYDNLEDLTGLGAQRENQHALPNTPYSTPRTETWLRGTASQLHIALNSLAPLIKHQNPSALNGLAVFSVAVLSNTTLTLPQSRPLLLSFLLSLRISTFERVSAQADASLRHLLTTTSTSRHRLLQALLHISHNYLTSLPRLLVSHADAKVEHAAELASPSATVPGIHSIAVGVGQLLGPNGGVEKWGWSLLSNMEFDIPSITIAPTSATQLLLENDSSAPRVVPFPELKLRHLGSRSAREALERMLRSLGEGGGDGCLFALEWFLDRSAAAMWCACRLLEGVGHVSLSSPADESVPILRSRRLEKISRDIAKQLAEDWDEWIDEDSQDQPPEDNVLVEHVHGLVQLSSTSSHTAIQPFIHRGLSLQLLSITSGILESRFPPLLLQALYPILHGIVSDNSFISTSGLAALSFVTNVTSYATPANLLLSNFDYALDSVSRHLSRRWLDIDATKVLAVLVRLVGRDVVLKAGDVVEECFDRLDEYHGYELVVDGLVEVLGEVVKAIEEDEEHQVARASFLQRHAEPAPSLDADKPIADPSPSKDKQIHRDHGEEVESTAQPPLAEIPPTPSQLLTTQIVSRSMYFLTHSSPTIRARILLLLARAVPVLPESALLPSIHKAWPFILNRLDDAETFVTSAAAVLIEALSTHVGNFMSRRIWDDVWPRFRTMLDRLCRADASSALARRAGGAGVGTESAYTHSHRLYRALISTMAAAVRGVDTQDAACWEIIVLFRRFLRSDAHEELQTAARGLYKVLSENNEDAVWLGLAATVGWIEGSVAFLREPKWNVERNVKMILEGE